MEQLEEDNEPEVVPSIAPPCEYRNPNELLSVRRGYLEWLLNNVRNYGTFKWLDVEQWNRLNKVINKTEV